MRRVAVTGLGTINAAGANIDDFWGGVKEGASALSLLGPDLTGGLPLRLAGRVTGVDPKEMVPRRFRAKTDRFTHLAFIAVEEALRVAGIGEGTSDPNRTGVWFGNNTGGWELCEQGFREYYGDGPDVVNPWQATAWFLAAPQGFLTIRHGFRGPSKSFSGDRTSGATALYFANRAVSAGRNEVAVAGGTEAPLTPLALSCFHSNGEMSASSDPLHGYRAFSSGSSGIVLGEGAAAVILEPEVGTDVASGGRDPYAIIAGASQGTGSGPNAAQRYADVIRRALGEADCDPTEIDLVLCDGAGEQTADSVEAAALGMNFRTGRPTPVVVPKSLFGHLYGASFATDVISGCLAAYHGIAPGNPAMRDAVLPEGLEALDRARHQDIRRFLVCSRSRYGSCVAMVFHAKGEAASAK